MALEPAKLRDMTPNELAREEAELRDQIWKLRLQRTTGALQDPGKVTAARRDLARVLTIRREKELGR